MSPRRWDSYLPAVQSNKLTYMARVWAGVKLTRKDPCIEAVCHALTDQKVLQQALTRLQPHERNALALLKLVGGSCDATQLSVALYASGAAIPPPHWGRPDAKELARLLIDRGIVLGDISYMADVDTRGHIFADERIMALVDAPQVESLSVAPTKTPSVTSFRRPQVVTLDIISILHAIDRLGGLGLTQSGSVRVADARKLLRALGQSGDSLRVDDTEIPDAARAFTEVFRNFGLFVQQGQRLVLSQPSERFAALSYADQVRSVVAGFVGASGWDEFGSSDRYFWRNHAHQARLSLLMILAALPGDGFFSLDDIEMALFQRIGGFFSVGYFGDPPYFYRETIDEQRAAMEKWRVDRRAQWLKEDKPWLIQALGTWPYYLGLVELGRDGRQLVAVRLTDLGRSVLRPGTTASENAAPPPGASSWLIQPTFEIIVYLEHVTPLQMAFLERNSERVQVQQHTALYRLTRESVYRGLESGVQLDDLLSRLRAGSGAEIPQNVEAEIRSWASLREQMTLHRRASLLEYANAAQRDVALRQGIKGQALGERYILCAPGGAAPGAFATAIDYARPLPACFTAKEDGIVLLAKTAHDLLAATQFDGWAERLPDTSAGSAWRFTEASIAAAARSGANINDLLNLLTARLIHQIPPLLVVSLHAWSGLRYDAVVGTITILRCSQPAVMEAIRESEKLRPYLLGAIAPDILVVNAAQGAELARLLPLLGIKVSGQLAMERLNQRKTTSGDRL